MLLLEMYWLLFFQCFVSLVVCVPPHSHKKNQNQKENAEDANFNPRDDGHFKDGEHSYEFDHESVLGSHDAADKFDHFPAEESKMRLRDLALKMDKDGDSFVDQEELTQWVLRSFKMLTEEEALDQLEEEDADEDSRVSWDEHAIETYGVYDDQEDESDDYPLIQNDKELFKSADRNGDGYLDKSEFSSFSHPEEFKHMYEVVFQQAMKKRDLNQDGFLSLHEFIADNEGALPSPNAENYITEKDRFENDYDLNGDGKMDKEEILSWLIPNNVEMAESEANHLISSSDDDGDGKLSIEEIVNHHEIFVGSEATDYGEHLHNTHKFTDEL